MAKIEIVGPKGRLDDVLSLLQERGVLQIESSLRGFIDPGDAEAVSSFLPEEDEIAEIFFLRDVRKKIAALFSLLPPIAVRTSYLEPLPVIDVLSQSLERHLSSCGGLSEERDALRKELADLNRYAPFLDKMEAMLRQVKETRAIDFIGLTLKSREAVDLLRTHLAEISGRKFELITDTAADGTLVGLIIIRKELSDRIKGTLSERNIPELRFPAEFTGLSFPEKIAHIRKRLPELTARIETLSSELERIASRWKPLYEALDVWAANRLALLDVTSSVFETKMCFYLCGWMSVEDVAPLVRELEEGFGGTVVFRQKEIREEDLGRIPILLRNPAYFRPFEILTRMLPLPRYTSYDPTPFIGIFFPIFFGMILGDAGYGTILLVLSLILKRRFRKHRTVRDASSILFVISLYTVFFGILYGEFFGDLAHTLFGLEPICIERQTSIIPMLLFALTVGVAHILLGLVLGAVAAFRAKERREAVTRTVSVLIILCVLGLLASLSGVLPRLLARPVIITILVLTPVLLFSGGLLAPLELLKSIGNIISYARIMAIGLTSVLLAFVANRLAGLTGDIVIGILVASLLHLLNLIIGVFSPAIHSLRLHYVEFFGKFIEPGGRKFEPLHKENRMHRIP